MLHDQLTTTDLPLYESLRWFLYLGADSEHLQRRWNVQVLGYPDVAEVNGEGFAPDAEIVDVEDGQVAW